MKQVNLDTFERAANLAYAVYKTDGRSEIQIRLMPDGVVILGSVRGPDDKRYPWWRLGRSYHVIPWKSLRDTEDADELIFVAMEAALAEARENVRREPFMAEKPRVTCDLTGD